MQTTSSLLRLLFFTGLFAVLGPPCCVSAEVTIERSGKSIELTGEILIDAQDDSLLFQANDGQLWIIKSDEIKSKQETDSDAAPIDPDQLSEKLLAELPGGFRILKKEHYVIAYQTELAYAKWIAGLYEGRLYRSFERFWTKKKVALADPKFPLVAIIFANKPEYERYAARELGGEVGATVAYYNLMTNRVTMYDLTADDLGGGQTLDDRKLKEVLTDRRAIPMVATIIHEATHQLMFNRGLQQRLADTPLWLNEGLALFFEAPDLKSKRGWRTPGKINQPRFDLFVRNYSQRPPNSLATMLTDDGPFQQAETGLAAYAEAWAFNHFLLNRRSKQFAGYLKHMSQHKPLATVTPKQRLADFQQFFGDDMDRLERDFIKYMKKLR